MGVCDLGQICDCLVSGLKACLRKPSHEISTKVEDHRRTEVFLWFFVKFNRKERRFPMNEQKKKTIKRIVDIIITILTALLTTFSANAAGLV